MLPGTDDRMFVAGMTGSGKTTFIMKVLLAKFKQESSTIFVILDTGNQWESQKQSTLKYKKDKPIEITNRTNLKSLEPGYIYVYRPKPNGYTDGFVGKIFTWAFKAKQVCIVIDEARSFSKGALMQPELDMIVHQGRKRHVCTIIGSQRPSAIPLDFVTEAQYFAVFHLHNVNDRERLASWISPNFYIEVDGHNFQFWKPEMKEPVLIRQDKKEEIRK